MTPEQEIVAKEKQPLEGTEKTRPGRYFQPDVDICETDQMLRMWVDMPGVADQDANITLKDNILSISGIVTASPYEKLAPRYTEYNVGNYYREFMLHEDIDGGAITARMRNGVLAVELPKRQQAQARRIQVQAS